MKDEEFKQCLEASVNGSSNAEAKLLRYLTEVRGDATEKRYEHQQQAYGFCSEKAKQGSSHAQALVGCFYYKGIVVKRDVKEAVKWYQLAAKQGHREARFTLGCFYQQGEGVKAELKEATLWYRFAAEQGHGGAQYNLGWLYQQGGKGVKKDAQEAVYWYQLAAEQGHAKAQYNLGWMYENGEGIPKSIETAIKWYTCAEAQGDDEAKKKLVALKTAHTPVSATTNQQWVKTLYDYKAQHKDELSFAKSETIQVIQEHPNGWWEGELQGRRGLFPSNYVKPVATLTGSRLKGLLQKIAPNETKSLPNPASTAQNSLGVELAKSLPTQPMKPIGQPITEITHPSLEKTPAIKPSPLFLAPANQGNIPSLAHPAKAAPKESLAPPFNALDIAANLQHLQAIPTRFPVAEPRVSAPGTLSIDVRLDYSDLTFEHDANGLTTILGQGAFGTVYRGTYHGSSVAIKQLNKDLDEKTLEAFFDEVSVMKSMHSPRIVQCYGMTITPYTLVMEYMAGGTLHGRLQATDKPITWANAYQWCLEMSYGLEYLHKKDIVHGDLKSDNVLLDEKGSAKLADFGGAKVKVTSVNSSMTLFGQKAGGTPNYLAPELWGKLNILTIPKQPGVTEDLIAGFTADAKTTKASDVYSLGLLFCEITTRQMPFYSYFYGTSKVSLSVFKALIVEKGLQETPNPKTPPRLKEVMQYCWFKAPTKRPAINQVLNEIKTEADRLSPAFCSTLIPKL